MTSGEWLPSESVADICDFPLQFNGFCGYTFVSKDGLLLPGTVPSASHSLTHADRPLKVSQPAKMASLTKCILLVISILVLNMSHVHPVNIIESLSSILEWEQ